MLAYRCAKSLQIFKFFDFFDFRFSIPWQATYQHQLIPMTSSYLSSLTKVDPKHRSLDSQVIPLSSPLHRCPSLLDLRRTNPWHLAGPRKAMECGQRASWLVDMYIDSCRIVLHSGRIRRDLRQRGRCHVWGGGSVMDPGLLLAALDPIGPSSRWPTAYI